MYDPKLEYLVGEFSRPRRRFIDLRFPEVGLAIECDEAQRAAQAEEDAEPEDVANAFVFPASELSSYVTGAVLPVDGAARV